MSFLLSPEALREELSVAGFTIVSWKDASDLGRTWFRDMSANKGQPGKAPSVGLQVVLGPDLRTMSKNVLLNLEEGRISLAEIVAR